MVDHPNARTVAAIEKMMSQMQYLVDHPRMQQRNWVARGREWLPVLEHAKQDLQREVTSQDFIVEAYQSLMSVLERVGLTVEKRDETTWGYRWHGNILKGTYITRAEAFEAGLWEKLDK
jgi:hypothetical protein